MGSTPRLLLQLPGRFPYPSSPIHLVHFHFSNINFLYLKRDLKNIKLLPTPLKQQQREELMEFFQEGKNSPKWDFPWGWRPGWESRNCVETLLDWKRKQKFHVPYSLLQFLVWGIFLDGVWSPLNCGKTPGIAGWPWRLKEPSWFKSRGFIN